MSTKFLFVSNNGDSLPIAWRMQEEGADVAVYIHNATFRENYRGLLKTVLPLDGLKQYPLGRNTVAIFDMVRPRETASAAAHEDDALLRAVYGQEYKGSPGEGVFGPLAHKLASVGTRVIGMTQTTELIEFDRGAGKSLARDIGLSLPPHEEFSSVDDAITALRNSDPAEKFVLKPYGNDDLDLTYLEHWPGELMEKLQTNGFAERLKGKRFILERYIDGITLDEEVWWNGAQFKALNSTIEHKRFGVGDIGPNVGSSLNVVWAKGQSLVPWRRLIPFLEATGYIGPIDATFQVDAKNRAWFLEWGGFRLGYDAVFCLMSLLRGKISDFFQNNFGVGLQDDCVAASIRFSVQPYPYEDKALREKYAAGTPILSGIEDAWWQDVKLGKRGLECAGADGILGAMVGRGDEPRQAMDAALSQLRRLKVAADLQYRTDGQLLHLEWRRLSKVAWASMC